MKKEEIVMGLYAMRLQGKNRVAQERNNTVDRAVELINQLDEPEKVVIPKFVADWIDAHNLYGNNPLREYRDLEIDFNEGWTDEEDATVYHWVNKNPYAFIDALRYGCEVEEEQKYRVIDRHKVYLLAKEEERNKVETVAKLVEIYGHELVELNYQLTEQEIKDYDKRYWAFAEEVTE